MTRLAGAFALLCCLLGSVVQAATMQNFELSGNQWLVLEFRGTDRVELLVDPINKNGSFSFTYAFSANGCGPGANQHNTWSCMPSGFETNTVRNGHSYNFGQGWFDKVDRGSVRDPVSLSYLGVEAENLFVFFRVNSGSGSISNVAAMPSPAPVPLPATGLLLVAGLAGLSFLKSRRRIAG